MIRHLCVLTLLGAFALGSTGCGLLFGRVKPVDEKSESYGVADLAKDNPGEWKRLDPQTAGEDKKDPNTSSSEVPDVAYQSEKTAGIISLNSACRPPGAESTEQDLMSYSKLLFLGISDLSQNDEQTIQVQDQPAAQTTVEGKMNGEAVKIRTVVLRRNGCVYDLVYISRPDHFAANEPDFSRFVASLRLK